MEEEVLAAIRQVGSFYHRLVLVVGPYGSGKTLLLKNIAAREGYRYINVSLEMSRAMLGLTQVQRCLRAFHLLEQMVASTDEPCVLLDELAVLFEPSLKQDPLRLLQQVSRNRTIVAAWDGSVDDGYLVYAEPGHPEYRRYPVNDSEFVLVRYRTSP